MKKILLIDDDPDIITVLQLLLKKRGYEVATAAREDETYKQVAFFEPDLIVLDSIIHLNKIIPQLWKLPRDSDHWS